MNNLERELKSMIDRGSRIHMNRGQFYCDNKRIRRQGLIKAFIGVVGNSAWLCTDVIVERNLVGKDKILTGGVDLQLQELLSSKRGYCIFNVHVTRDRQYADQEAGTLYKNKKQFRVGHRHLLSKLWLSTFDGFPNDRPSGLWQSIGKLKNCVYSAPLPTRGEKLKKSALEPLTISYDQFLRAWNRKFSSTTTTTPKNIRPTSDRKPTQIRQLADKLPTSETDKDFSAAHAAAGFPDNKSTERQNCGNTVHGSKVRRLSPLPFSISALSWENFLTIIPSRFIPAEPNIEDLTILYDHVHSTTMSPDLAVQKYHQQWLQGMDSEGLSERKQDAGRLRAAQWLNRARDASPDVGNPK